MHRMTNSEGLRPVTIEFEGRTITGSYRISREIITVTSSGGSKRAHIGPFQRYPENLARLMLRELAVEGRV